MSFLVRMHLPFEAIRDFGHDTDLLSGVGMHLGTRKKETKKQCILSRLLSPTFDSCTYVNTSAFFLVRFLLLFFVLFPAVQACVFVCVCESI
jgi:hypothetical protein